MSNIIMNNKIYTNYYNRICFKKRLFNIFYNN